MDNLQKCSVCGQTDTYPGYWPENDEHIHIEFHSCSDCGAINVCPDCLHERECCDDTETKLSEINIHLEPRP